jgi:hypothetical protein
MKKIVISIIVLFLCCGCRPWNIKNTPSFQVVDNGFYSIQLLPSGRANHGFTSFDLTIENKKDSDIDLVWDKTYFIYNGQTNGGFMFEGIVFKDRNNPKSNDVIFAKNKFQKTIWPNNLVSFDTTIGWYHYPMNMGDNGIYITLIVNGKEIREKLLINMSFE